MSGEGEGIGEVAILVDTHKSDEPITAQINSKSKLVSIQHERQGTKLDEVSGEKRKVLEAYDSLAASQETEHVAALYTEIVAKADVVVDNTRTALSQLQGASLIPEKAHQNITAQACELLLAIHNLSEKQVTVSLFGERKTFKHQDELVAQLERIARDFDEILGHGASFDEFNDKTLPILDKYLFGGIEIEDSNDFNILVLEDGSDPLLRELSARGIVDAEAKPSVYAENKEPFEASKIAALTLPRSLTGEEFDHLNPSELAQAVLAYKYPLDKPFDQHKQPPDIVIIDQRNLSYPQDLFIHYDPDKQEDVISYNPVQVILVDRDSVERDSYMGTFLICHDLDEFTAVMNIAKSLVNLSKNPPVNVDTLVALQQSQYETSDDLSEWAEKTAKLDRELEDIFTIFKRRESDPQYPSKITADLSPDQRWYFERVEQEERDVITVLDVGGGYGRIGAALARAGKHVVNLDPTLKLQELAKQRLKALGTALRGEGEFPDNTAEILKKLHAQGLIPSELVLDDTGAEKNYVLRQGDFQTLYENLYNLMKNDWKQVCPDKDIWDFFVPPGRLNDKYSYIGEDFLWSVVGFDAAIETWHTACEKPTLELQRSGAEQVFNTLEYGGVYIIEIPDRTVDPYASAIHDYHEKHPDERLGTHRETYTANSENGESEEKEFTPRYFPDRNEIVLLLRSVGFEVNPEEDISTYFITVKDEKTGEEKLQAKELVITAHKPWQGFTGWVV